VDETPKGFVEELRSSLLRRRVGQIALAVVLAEAAWQFVRSLVWYLVVPVIARALQGNTESVLFTSATRNPFPWENLFRSLLEFISAVILVFYLNRWVQRRPAREGGTSDCTTENVVDQQGHHVEEGQPEYSLVGQALGSAELPNERIPPTP
jgi:large-conductance mechanosensitive channel